MEKNEKQSGSLIYGVNERPALRDTLFAAIQHLLAIFIAIITPPLIIAKALHLDLAFDGSFRVGHCHLYSMPEDRSCGLRTALCAGHQLLIHRPHHCNWQRRRSSAHLRSVYCRRSGGDDDELFV